MNPTLTQRISHYFADKKGITVDHDYSTTHFLPYDEHKLTPKNSSIPETTHRYDYREMGVLYNVYTKETKTGYERVTEIWDVTHGKRLERLEIIVR